MTGADTLRDWFGDALGERHGCRLDSRMALARPPCPYCQALAEHLAAMWRESPPT